MSIKKINFEPPKQQQSGRIDKETNKKRNNVQQRNEQLKSTNISDCQI